MRTTEGKLIKNVMGLSKRSHHTHLLKALEVTPVKNKIVKNAASLFYRLFQVDTPLLHLQSILLSNYICMKPVIEGTLIEKLHSAGYQICESLFNKQSYSEPIVTDGVVDSLKSLIYHENYIKPWSNEHFLTVLLTQAF